MSGRKAQKGNNNWDKGCLNEKSGIGIACIETDERNEGQKSER